MNWQFTPYMLVLLATALFLAALGMYSWRHRTVPGATPFVALVGVSAVAALAGAAELAGIDLATKIFWFKVRTVWFFMGATAAFCFALEYASPGKWLTRRNLALLSIPILVHTLLSFTDDAHHLMWSGFRDEGRVNSSPTVLTTGFNAYSMLLMLLNTVVFIGLFIRSPLHRWPVGVLLLGGLAPRVIVPLKTMGLVGFTVVDPLYVGCNFTALMFALALFGFRVFNVVPIARDLVIERMKDGVLVLDAHDQLMELNRAAEEFLDLHARYAIRRDSAQVLCASPGLLQVLGVPGTEHTVEVEIGQAHRCYEVRVSRLADARGQPLGRLVLLHEVTARKQAQVQVLQQQQALAVLQERARVARDLHDGAGQVLGYAKLQAQAAVELLARGRYAMADDYLDHLMGVTREAHVDLQEYALDTQRAIAQELGLLDALGQLLQRFGEHYGIATQLDVAPGWRDAAVGPNVRDQLLRIVQEALSNTRKHAHARHVRVSVSMSVGAGAYEGELQVNIADDGVGFDPTALAKDDGCAGGHRYGLRSMRERAQEAGGSLEVYSAPGQGVQVIVRVPLTEVRSQESD